MNENYLFAWSGKDVGSRAIHGVGFSMHPDTVKKNELQVGFVSKKYQDSIKTSSNDHNLYLNICAMQRHISGK